MLRIGQGSYSCMDFKKCFRKRCIIRSHSSEKRGLRSTYLDIDQGIHKGKLKVAQNEKQKK